MYTFFNKDFNHTPRTLKHPNIRYFERTLESTYQDVINYYRHASVKVDSSHLLFKIVAIASADYKRDPLDLYDDLLDSADRIASSARITCSNNRFRPDYSEFLLGRKSLKIIVSDVSVYDPTDIEDEWEDLEPIKYLRHQSTNLSFPQGDDVDDSPQCVISIDIPLLILQLQQWLKQPQNANAALGTFFGRYPLNNAKRSFFNQAMFNRTLMETYDQKIPTYRNKHPSDIPMFNTPILADKLISYYLVQLANRKYNFEDMLSQLDWGWSTALDTMRLPVVRDSIQMRWALFAARSDVIQWLLDVDDENPTSGNLTTINQWRAKGRDYMNNSTISNSPLTFQWKRQEQERLKSIYSDLLKLRR